jgi:F-type H+-transporting ATPase subunit c
MDANISEYAKAAVLVGAAIAMGIGTVGPSLAQGLIGSKACENIGKYPESASKIRMTMLLSMGLVETCALYAFIIALIVIYK